MRWIWAKSFVFSAVLAASCCPTQLRAQAALLLEEPYSYDGTFAGTGHTAIYLWRVCAESPTQLRRCRPEENGIVISRYHGIAGRDWLAIPLLEYLYAVKQPEQVPLYADAKLVALLRQRYLDTLPLPTEKQLGEEPRYQLAGSAYDRTIYGFRFATTSDQDDALIAWLNSQPNVERYQLLKRNCADFVKQIVNFYYPHAVHRSVIADLGVTTPKQAAKSLVHTARRRHEMQLTTFIIPQVPGPKRSKPIHGVIESLVLAKKYVTPVLLFHPLVVGTVEAAYWAGWRFDPSKGADVFDPASPDPMHTFGRPLTAGQRKAYANLVESARRSPDGAAEFPNWKAIAHASQARLDAQGRPYFEFSIGDESVPVGLCRGNVLRFSSFPELLQELALTRLELELNSKKPVRISEDEVKRDWKLFEAAREARQASLHTR